VLGVPGFVLALLASRLREPRRRPPPTIRATVEGWYARGRARVRQALRLGMPLIWLTLAGTVLSGALDRFAGLPPGLDTAAFAAWGLAGGALGALFGGRTGDWLLARWSGGRVVVSGAGFVLGGPVCAALLLIDELRLFVPLLFATFFLYSWYNGPLSAVILDVVPAAVRASVLGAFVLFSHLAGDAIAPPLIGYLSDRFGLRAAMLLLPTAGAVGGRVILIALTTVGRDMARVKQ